GGDAVLPVRAHLELEPNAAPWLTERAAFFVGVQGIVGESYIEIVASGGPGTPLPPDSIVRGVDAPELHLLARRLASLAAFFSPGDGDDEGAPGGVASAVATLARDTDAVLRLLAQDLPGILAQAKAAVATLATLGERLERVATPDLLGAVSQDMLIASRELADAATQASKSMEELRAGQGTLGALTKDKQLYEDLKVLIDELKRHPWKLLWRE
ncbi:MAG: hypothetical protein AAB426_04595, partial [Myxococcota bacterium]